MMVPLSPSETGQETEDAARAVNHSLAPVQFLWPLVRLNDSVIQTIINLWATADLGTGVVPKLQAHALMKVAYIGRLNDSSSLRLLGPLPSILDKPTVQGKSILNQQMAETVGKVQPKCHLMDAIDYYIHLELDANLALDTSYWSQRFIDL